MKRYAAIVALLTLLLALSAQGQGYNAFQKTTFSSVSTAAPLKENTIIGYHKLSWTVTGSPASCTVAIDSSADNITYSAGGILAGQTCTTNGNSGSATAASANYIRVNVTALSAAATVTVTYTGYVANPSGGGGAASVGLSINSGSTCGAAAVTGSPVTTTGTLNINFTGVSGDVLSFNGSNCPQDSGTLLSSLTAKISAATSSSTVGAGGFWGLFGIEQVPYLSTIFLTETGDITANNVLRVWEFTLPTQQIVGHINWNITSVGSATGTITYDLGIACAPNNSNCTSGNVLISTGGTVISGTGNKSAIPTQAAQVTLQPGTYYFFDCGNATTNINTMGQIVFPVNIVGTSTFLMNVNGKRYGTAANTCTAGVAPSTLGTVTNVNSNTADAIAAFFEP